MTVRPTVLPVRAVGMKAFVLMLALVCATALAFPSRADASPLTELDVILIDTPRAGGEPVLLVAGELPLETPLPAEIVLPVPEGAVVSWSGEILGGPVENDPAVEARLEERNGIKVAAFTLSVSRIGQVEVTFPGAVSPGEGGSVAGGFRLVAPVDIQTVRMAVAVPPTYEVTDLPEGALVSTGPQGDIYYYVETPAVATGDPIEHSIQYNPATIVPASGPAGATPPGQFPLLMVLIVAAVLAGALLVFFAARSRAAAVDVGDVSLAYEPEDELEDDALFDDGDEPSAADERPAARRRKGSM
ncbi:MAG TPA: hypothetical protein VFH17_00520 [Coriobacteriia bacterium]|nr:hypothetical protein [Coriobacteriia bacterium]